MNNYLKSGIGALALALGVGAVMTLTAGRSEAQKDGAGPVTVVSTDGAHLIAVDNKSNKLFFYAIDKEGKVGDEMKLRGTVDLSQVGGPSIKPMDAKPQR